MSEPFLEFMALLARQGFQGFTPPRGKSPDNTGTSSGPRRPNNMSTTNMSTELTTTNTSDGWSDAAAEAGERIIKGTLLKFSDWNWSKGKEGTKIDEGYKLVALDTAAAWVKWQDSKPAEYRMRQPGQKLPDREELGDDDESAWETGPDDNPRDPWRNTRFVYLIDPLTAEAFTFSTSSWGGRGAVSDLADQIQRVRYARPGAVPMVELHAAPMLTKYGKKSKPFFKVIDWRGGGEVEPKQIEESKKGTPTERAFDDQIPW
jgi:hypothetical protein